MRMSEKGRNNNNSDNPLTSRRTDGGKKRGCTPCYAGVVAYRVMQMYCSLALEDYSEVGEAMLDRCCLHQFLLAPWRYCMT